MELRRTDGTAAGTTLVKDIYGGSGSGSPSNVIKINSTLYFLAVSSAQKKIFVNVLRLVPNGFRLILPKADWRAAMTQIMLGRDAECLRNLLR